MQHEQTLLGFDFGLRRIGVAVGQTLTAAASPLTVLLAQQGDPCWREVDVLIKKWQPAALVVGLPLNMDGSVIHVITAGANGFAAQLRERYALPVHVTDERLSTRAAYDLLPTKLRRPGKQRKAIDSFAAMVILQQWLIAAGNVHDSE